MIPPRALPAPRLPGPAQALTLEQEAISELRVQLISCIALVGIVLLLLAGNLVFLAEHVRSADAFAIVAWVAWIGWLATLVSLGLRRAPPRPRGLYVAPPPPPTTH